MGPDLEPKEKPDGMLESFSGKENGCAPKNSENRLMRCTSNYEDRTFLVEPLTNDQREVQDCGDDVEVNIDDCTHCDDVEPIEARCNDATESMSSFGDTESDSENASICTDEEVESRLCISDYATNNIFEGFGNPFQLRKKKFTDHWTRFIRPVATRCRWLELHIKELARQAQKYDRKLAEIENKKLFANECYLAEGVQAKTLPFPHWERKVKIMKRRRRSKIEETVEVDSYMAQHSIFSLYENKKSTADALYVGEDYINPDKTRNDNDVFGFQDGWAVLESKGCDNIHETFIRKIDTLQLLVRKLKKRIDKVMNENSGRFSSIGNSSLLTNCDALPASEQNPRSPSENGDCKPVKSCFTQQLSKGNVSNLLPEIIVSTHEQANPISDIIENSVLPHFGVSCKEEVLTHNQAAKEEIQSLKDFGNQLANNLQVSTEKTVVQASESNSLAESFMARVQFGGKTLPKSRTNISTGKRKRGRRKSTGGRRRK